MAGAGAAELAREELALQLRVPMRLLGAERLRLGVTAQAGADVETPRLERVAVVSGHRVGHVADARELGVDGAPDSVSAVALEAGVFVRDRAASPMDRRQ